MRTWRHSFYYWGLAGIVTVIAAWFFLAAYGSEDFMRGAAIGGVDVGGKNRSEAARLVQAYADAHPMQILVEGPDGYSRKLALESVGGTADAARSVDTAWEKEKTASLGIRLGAILGRPVKREYPILIRYDEDGVNRWIEMTRFDVDRKPSEPRILWDDGAMSILPATPGRQLDVRKARQSLPGTYQAGTVKVSLETVPVLSSVKETELTGLTEIAAFHTTFNAGNVNRTSNLKKAANALNGTVVPRGGVFSFNQAVGPRDLASGYKEAMVIIKNEFKPGVGGGICQVSSTLYNACLLAGLPIVERYNHSVAVAYVPVGLDATVAYPARDFKFKNDMDSAIYLNAYTRGNELWVKVFGRRQHPLKVKLERYVDKVFPFTTVQQTDSTLKPGERKVDHEGVNGYKVRTYRTIMDENMKVLERKQLATDTYVPLNKLVLVGPAPPATPPATAEPPASQEPPAGGGTEEPPVPADTQPAEGVPPGI